MPALSLTSTESFNLFMYQILFCRMRRCFLCIIKNCEDNSVMIVMFPLYRENRYAPNTLPLPFNLSLHSLILIFLLKFPVIHAVPSFLFFIHQYLVSHILLPRYPHMHISVRINLPAKPRYQYFALLKIKSHHAFPSRSFPCLYCVFHIHFGIKRWDSRCCMGTLMLTLNSNHSVMTWLTRIPGDDLLLVTPLCSVTSGIYDSNRNWRNGKMKHPQVLKHPQLPVAASQHCGGEGWGWGVEFWHPCSAQRERST